MVGRVITYPTASPKPDMRLSLYPDTIRVVANSASRGVVFPAKSRAERYHFWLFMKSGYNLSYGQTTPR